jgi:hypothetical protein
LDTSYAEDESYGEYGQDDYSEPEDIPNNKSITIPTTVAVPYGVSLQEAGKEVYTDLLDWEEKYDLGGVKLCAEMSADREGKPYSSFREPTAVTFRPPPELHLVKANVGASSPDIVSRIVNRDIDVQMGPVQNQHNFLSFICFTVNITICNRTDRPIAVRVPQGQMIEVQAPHVQNIVVIEPAETELSPSQTKTMSVKAYCAAEKRQDPTNYHVKLTPFILSAPSTAYRSQNALWDFLRTEPNNTIEGNDSYSEKKHTITFYAWGSGSENDRGEKSDFGHAFVYIPEIGTVGYGGTVTDHKDKTQYAKYKVNIPVSEASLRNVKDKYREWKDNPPEYDLMKYDCTTFVMDIADAAGIKYGSRWMIQSPAGFMRELQRHNK